MQAATANFASLFTELLSYSNIICLYFCCRLLNEYEILIEFVLPVEKLEISQHAKSRLCL